jgi:UDPglucose 6-dehydrogenase
MGESDSIKRLVNRSDIEVVSNPEFLREGFAIYDSFNPERIVVGAKNSLVAQRVASLFESTHAPQILTDNVTAETIKYASNAFLAAKLSFVNQVTNFCDAVGADSEDVLKGMSLDRRIGSGHMRPSPGWGGPCLQKDSLALLDLGIKNGFDFTMVRTAIEANEFQLDLVVEKVRESLLGALEGRTVAVWGLTFKAETNDLRNSPAIDIVRRLVAHGATIRAHDPSVSVEQSGLPEGVQLFDDKYAACEGAHALVILTEWDDFRTANFEKVALLLESSKIVDGRNILEPQELRDLNFTYVGLGRRTCPKEIVHLVPEELSVANSSRDHD